MNIAILDFTLSKTHIRFNIANFEQLRKLGNLYIVNSAGYYDQFAEKYNNVKLFQSGIVLPDSPINSIYARCNYINYMRINAKLFKKYRNIDFDVIIIMGFDVIVFSLYKIFIPKNIPVFIFQHQQLDELENRVKRLFYFTYRNSVHHIVLESPFEEYMKKNLGARFVHTVHNISYVSGESDCLSEEKWIVALSSHNDDTITSEIVEEQTHTQFLEKNNIHMYIRSQTIKYEDNNLKVSYEFLTGKEYDNLYKKAFAVLTPIPAYFHRRISGPVIDGMTNGKVVICSNKEIFHRYASIAPSLFRYFENINELKKIIETDNWIVNEAELSTVKKIYGPENIYIEYKKMLDSIT